MGTPDLPALPPERALGAQASPFDRHVRPPEPSPPPTPYGRRFAAITAALAALCGAAVMGAVLVARGHGSTPAPAWSSWHPTAADQDGLAQIATHVARRYRLGNGRQLLSISPGLEDAYGAPLRPLLAVTKPGARQGDIPGVSPLSGTTVFFRFCGGRSDCGLQGRPSAARLTLVRREALEVALYAMRYDGDVDSVLVLLPPVTVAGAATTPPALGLLFRRADLRPELSRPLDRTLPGTPPAPRAVTPAETRVIDRLTAPGGYAVLNRQLSDGTQVLVLDRLVS